MVSRARNQPDLTSPGGPPLIEFSCFGVARRLPICAAGLIDAPSHPLRGLLGLPAPPRAAGVHSCVRGEGRDRQVGLVRVVGAIHRSGGGPAEAGARRPPACRRPCRVCCASRRPRGGPVPGGQSPLRPVRTTHASGRAQNIIEWGLRWLRGARARVRRAHRGGGQAARLARPHVLATRSHVVGGHTCDQREVCKHNLGPEIKFGVAASDRKRPDEGGS